MHIDGINTFRLVTFLNTTRGKYSRYIRLRICLVAQIKHYLTRFSYEIFEDSSEVISFLYASGGYVKVLRIRKEFPKANNFGGPVCIWTWLTKPFDLNILWRHTIQLTRIWVRAGSFALLFWPGVSDLCDSLFC